MKLIPQSAKKDTEGFIEAEEFSPASEGIDQYCANLQAVRRVSTCVMKLNSKFFNFYFESEILKHLVLPMGYSSSPFLSRICLDSGFTKAAFEDFITDKNIDRKDLYFK